MKMKRFNEYQNDDKDKNYKENTAEFEKINCNHKWMELTMDYSWCEQCGIVAESDNMYGDGDSPNYYWIPVSAKNK